MKLTGCMAKELQTGKDSLNEYVRVMAQRSKVNQRSYPQKAHLLDMTFIPAWYEMKGLHSKGTTGRKSKRDVWQWDRWMDIQTDGQTAPTNYYMCFPLSWRETFMQRIQRKILPWIVFMHSHWRLASKTHIVTAGATCRHSLHESPDSHFAYICTYEGQRMLA